MLTKNLTPFLFGAKVTSRRPPQPEATLIVRGCYKIVPGAPLELLEGLDQGFLSAETYRDEDEERRGEALSPSDFADYKLNAEVILVGACHAPGGRPVVECPVRLSVGAWSKALRVVGPRAFSDRFSGARMSEPLAFSSMPLDWAHAFGGPTFARNPVGKGHDGAELPNVESLAAPIRSPADRPEPAGFGPISPAWPQRASKVGTQYGEAYQKKRAPYYAEDFDWSYFSAAPADQQLPGFLRGDEEVGLFNLHAIAPSFTFRLPGLRVRAFVKDVAERFREVPLSLDTLFLDMNKGLVYLTWRGLGEVREDDLTDLAFALVASEPLAERPMPELHYRMLLEEFVQDPTGVRASLPAGLVEAGEAMEKRRAGEETAVDPSAPDPVSGAIGKLFGKLMDPGVAGKVGEGMAASVKHAASQGVDLGAAVGAAVAKAGADTAPTPYSIKPGVLPSPRLKDTMRAVMGKVAELKKAAADSGKQVQGIEALEALPHDPRLKQLDPAYAPPGPVSNDTPGPGRNLAEHDLRGRDLSGMDLSAASFEGADLSGANLRGARLVGANLKFAILYKADLSGADLSGADLTLVNAAEVRAAGAVFKGATLEQGFFEGADLSGADLGEAQGQYIVFVRANLEAARAQKARLDHSDFSEAKLAEANLSLAVLERSSFQRCRAKKADLSGAVITGCNFSEAELSGARFARARGDRSYWVRAVLDEADFTLAVMLSAHFTEASAAYARFYGANLREGRFYRARLEGAQIVRANLFGADLRKARLGGASFVGASLYDAKLLGASGAGCDFTDANLKRSTLERA